MFQGARLWSYPDYKDACSAGQKNEVSDEEPDDPDDGETNVDELEALAGSREQIPTLKYYIHTI